MIALSKYLELACQVRESEDPPDEILDEMDPLWWGMTDDERRIVEMSDQGKWLLVGGFRYCPFCGHSTPGEGTPPRCMNCMRDVIPEVVS